MLDGRLQLCRALHDPFLQLFLEAAYFILRMLALRDVTNVALNNFFVTHLIHIADKLHGDFATVSRFERQVLVTDVPMLLKSLQHGLVGLHVLKWTKLTNRLPNHFISGEAQEFYQERIHVGDAPRVDIQNQDAVFCRFKQATSFPSSAAPLP